MRKPPLRTVGLLAAVLCAATPAFAQLMPKVEFDEAVRRAIDQNPTIAEATTNIARAEAVMRQTRSGSLPFVNLAVTNNTLDGSRGFEGLVTQPQNQFSFAASAGMPVLAMSQWAAVNQARDQIEVANRSVADVRKEIAVAAARSMAGFTASRVRSPVRAASAQPRSGSGLSRR